MRHLRDIRRGVTDGRMDGPMDGPTDGPTDRPSYRDAMTHLTTFLAEVPILCSMAAMLRRYSRGQPSDWERKKPFQHYPRDCLVQS